MKPTKNLVRRKNVEGFQAGVGYARADKNMNTDDVQVKNLDKVKAA
jgi:hypothetical protein